MPRVISRRNSQSQKAVNFFFFRQIVRGTSGQQRVIYVYKMANDEVLKRSYDNGWACGRLARRHEARQHGSKESEREGVNNAFKIG